MIGVEIKVISHGRYISFTAFAVVRFLRMLSVSLLLSLKRNRRPDALRMLSVNPQRVSRMQWTTQSVSPVRMMTNSIAAQLCHMHTACRQSAENGAASKARPLGDLACLLPLVPPRISLRRKEPSVTSMVPEKQR